MLLLKCFTCSGGAQLDAPGLEDSSSAAATASFCGNSAPTQLHALRLRPAKQSSSSSSSSLEADLSGASHSEARKFKTCHASRTETSTSVMTPGSSCGSKDGLPTLVAIPAGSAAGRGGVGIPSAGLLTLTGARSPLEPRAVYDGRTPSPAMLLSLRNLHLALVPADAHAASPSCFSARSASNSPADDPRPLSNDLITGLGDLNNSESSDPLSVSSLPKQLRVTTVGKLAEEVQELQLLGRGGYGMVITGNWRQEGRVAVKVLLSDEDKWMGSCYKEAILSKLLSHPNVLQTYDFQVAVVTEADVQQSRDSWEQASQKQNAQLAANVRQPPSVVDARLDSFELLPQVSANPAECGGDAARTDGAVDLWQVLFMLGARPGQFLTFIIMEYAEVGTLQRAISAGAFRESARLSKWAALRSLLVTAKEVAGGMCLLHSFKIIHGDLSATNVMLRCSRIDKRGFVAKVADFGLSKVTLSGVARTDDFAGQAQYMAPECLDYEARLASDVFAFGVLLAEMITGRKAFAEYAPAQILAGRLRGDLAMEWPPDAPPELRALAERCMRQDPEARPSFREVVDDLKNQDAEAKRLHRAHSARRRSTADGLLGPAGAIAARQGAPPGSAAWRRPPAVHTRAHRLSAAWPSADDDACSAGEAAGCPPMGRQGSSAVLSGAPGSGGPPLGCSSSTFSTPLRRQGSTARREAFDNMCMRGGALSSEASGLVSEEAAGLPPTGCQIPFGSPMLAPPSGALAMESLGSWLHGAPAEQGGGDARAPMYGMPHRLMNGPLARITSGDLRCCGEPHATIKARGSGCGEALAE